MISKECNQDGTQDKNQTSCPWRQGTIINNVQQLSTRHDIYRTPTNTSNNINGTEYPNGYITNH